MAKSINETISDLIAKPEMGTWTDEGDMNIYTPEKEFFDVVSPAQLAAFFHVLGRDQCFLRMP